VIDFVIKFLADYLVLVIALLGTACLLIDVRRGRYQVYGRMLMMGLTALLLAKLLTIIFHPDEVRPFIDQHQSPLATYINNPGFPSDHALFVMTIALAVWGATKRVSTSILLVIASLLVAFGRVIAKVHTPLDVTGGIVIACVAALIWYGPYLFTRRRRGAYNKNHKRVEKG